MLYTLSDGPVDIEWLGPAADTAPTLVFLHEGLGSIGLWKDFPQRLTQATGCGGLVYSRHGYGRSAAITLPRPLDYLHREAIGPLPELLAGQRLQRFILVGHSDGASIALLNAALAPAPGLLAVIAEAPHVFVEDVTVAGIQAARAAYDKAGPKGLRARLAVHHGDNVDLAFNGWADSWLHRDFRAWNIEAPMAHIAVPVLALQGRQDEYASLEQIDRILCRLPPELRHRSVIEECGHSPHLQHPAQVAEVMAEFIRGIIG